MGTKKDEEVLFAECKESVDDIFGWKIVIFLPQNPVWKVLVMSTITITFIVASLKVFYCTTNDWFSILEVFCDSFYCLDVLCATLHFSLAKTRQLKHGKNRPFFLLLVDFISLIPLNLFYEYLIYRVGGKSGSLKYILRANVLLRIYQMPMGFSHIKQSLCRITTYYIVILIEMLVYLIFLSHFLSCFISLYFDEAQKERCLKNFGFCILENDLLMFGILDNNFIDPFSDFPLEDYISLVTVGFLLGFIISSGYVTPLIIYMNLTYLKEFFEYSSKRKQLNLWIHNSIDDTVLKDKITNYFHYAWTYDRGDNFPEILNLFPLCFQKTIFCDIHWEAFKHSEFLQNLSIGCKRSLAMCMTTEFVLPKTILFKNKEHKTCFIYLETGLIQVMAEENNESPVLNLSDGTVLGEMSLFLQTESKAVLRAGMFSIIHILKSTDLFHVLLDYPKDMKIMNQKMKLRLQVAKAVYKNKTEICPLFLHDTNDIISTLSTVKWLKQQFRTIIKLKKAEELKIQTETRETIANYQRHVQMLETQLQHTSVYFSLLCLRDERESVENVVCLKVSFPWFFDPDSHFLIVWKILIIAVSCLVVILYPTFLGWYPEIPLWFFNLSVLINFIYVMDVFIRLATAVKINNVVIYNFSAVVSHKFCSTSFYVDIMAALPLYLLHFFNQNFQSQFKLNLLLSNTLLKSYKLINIVNNMCRKSSSGIFYRSAFKYLLVIFFTIYWSAAIFNLLAIECVFYECHEKDWLKKDNIKRDDDYFTIVSVYVALFMAVDLPHKNLHITEFPTFIAYFVIFIILNFLYYMWQGEFVACYVLENSKRLEYKNLQNYVNNYLKKSGSSKMVIKRVMSALKFQWQYDNGNYITQKRRLIDEFSQELRDDIEMKVSIPILQKSQLFKFEDEKFLVDLCRRANRLTAPAGSLLLTFGTQTMVVYVLHKGYVQINSFLPGDSHLNISTPLVFKTGDTFPVLMTLSQIPASITVLAVSDCEMLVLDLEDILTAMFTHGALPDVVQALKSTNLVPMHSAKLGVTRIRKAKQFDEKSYNAAFVRLKFLGTILKFLLKKRGIDSGGRMYLLWEVTRNLFIIFNLITWSLVFGSCSLCKCRLTLIKILLVLDIILSLVDFYIRLHLSYYNKLGVQVTHPLATFLRYLKSPFPLDLISFVPNLHIIHLLRMKVLNFDEVIIVIHIIMRSFSLYRVFGLFDRFIENMKKSDVWVKLLKCLFFIFLGAHYYANLDVYLYLHGKSKSMYCFSLENRVKPSKSYELYFYEMSLILSLLFNGFVFFERYCFYSLGTSIFFGTSSVLFETFFFSVLTLRVTAHNENFSLYQYYLRSFVKYLKSEKVDDTILDQAITYFEFKWQKHKGVEIHETFSCFPQTLHEDILYPLYKDTLAAARCLTKANEAFFRALARSVQMVNLMKSSDIIFENQVQEDIFFVHKGKCFVTEVSKTLIKGAIIGDIRRLGYMKHTIKALTHVDLLSIPSKKFFLIMQNFYDTKKAFEFEVADAYDFIESTYLNPEKSSLIEIESVTKQVNLEESEFEPPNDTFDDSVLLPLSKKSPKLYLKPNSKILKVFNLIFFIDAYITVLVLPIFMGITVLSWWAFSLIYILDVIWILKIILTTRTPLIHSKTGNYIYNRRIIINEYLHKFDGMVLHILSVLPIELIPLACYRQQLFTQHCQIMCYCYCNRLLRIPFIHYYIQSKMKELLANVYLKLLNIVVFGLALINLFVCVNLMLRRGKEFQITYCHWEIPALEIIELKKSYFFLINYYVGGGIAVCLPESFLEICFYLLIEIWALLSRSVTINKIIGVIFVTLYTKSNQLIKLQQLEKYLSIRSVSPPLLQKMQKYSCNLLNTYKEDAHPRFLKEIPPFLKIKIMEDLYMHHLKSCYVFQGVGDIFLRQLAMRLERFVFFPGDYIIEKGDVDHNMYFIHKGEVKCLELDQKYPVLERTVELFAAGDSFGVMQGICFACPHENTYRAKILTDLLILNFYKWSDLRAAFPDITKQIYKRLEQAKTTIPTET